MGIRTRASLLPRTRCNAISAALTAAKTSRILSHATRSAAAPHSGQTPDSQVSVNSVKRPLVRAVVLVLRGRIRPRHSSFLRRRYGDSYSSGDPSVRHYRFPQIVREVPDPFP